MISIAIYCPVHTPKVSYVFDFIFAIAPNVSFHLTHNYDKFASSDSDILINYSNKVSASAINIPYSDNLNLMQNPDFEAELILSDKTLNFDLIAAIFHLLSRVEEYNVLDKDEHGRYQSASSILHEKNLLHKPIIDIWVAEFYKLLSSYYSIDLRSGRKFNVVSTVDIDHIYAFKGKSLAVRTGSIIKDLLTVNIQKLKDRLASDDPFDTYAYIVECHMINELDCRYFILTSERSQYDKSLSPDHPMFLKVVGTLALDNEIGIHPSYDTYNDPQLIRSQKQRLEKIIDRPISASRQHFLRMDLPHTYGHLIESGITDDYSMGYPNVLGFRAGTSRAYQWYDMSQDQVTDLVIHPFALMDVTLRRVSDGNTTKAFELAKALVDEIKAVGGTFSLIWHNSSFYDTEGWAGWDKVYVEILTYAKSQIM